MSIKISVKRIVSNRVSVQSENLCYCDCWVQHLLRTFPLAQFLEVKVLFLVLQAPNWRMRSVSAWKCSRAWWESTQSIFWASRCCLSLATSSPCEGCPAPRPAHSWSTTWWVKPIGVWGSVAPSSSLAHLQQPLVLARLSEGKMWVWKYSASFCLAPMRYC